MFDDLDVPGDETIVLDLRGTKFRLSRDELLTLPEFVLLSLFPNGLFPEGHMGFSDADAIHVDVCFSCLASGDVPLGTETR